MGKEEKYNVVILMGSLVCGWPHNTFQHFYTPTLRDSVAGPTVKSAEVLPSVGTSIE